MLDPAAWEHIQNDLGRLRSTLDKYHDQFSSLFLIDNAIGFVEHVIIGASVEKDKEDKQAEPGRTLRLVK